MKTCYHPSLRNLCFLIIIMLSFSTWAIDKKKPLSCDQGLQTPIMSWPEGSESPLRWSLLTETELNILRSLRVGIAGVRGVGGAFSLWASQIEIAYVKLTAPDFSRVRCCHFALYQSNLVVYSPGVLLTTWGPNEF